MVDENSENLWDHLQVDEQEEEEAKEGNKFRKNLGETFLLEI